MQRLSDAWFPLDDRIFERDCAGILRHFETNREDIFSLYGFCNKLPEELLITDLGGFQSTPLADSFALYPLGGACG